MTKRMIANPGQIPAFFKRTRVKRSSGPLEPDLLQKQLDGKKLCQVPVDGCEAAPVQGPENHRAAAKDTNTGTIRFTTNWLNVSPTREPMMMFGGSPISVAVPPMLEITA